MAGTAKVTARQNIERALRHAGLFDLVTVTVEAEDRIYGRPYFRPAMLKARGWIEDPKCVARLLHEGAVESYREVGEGGNPVFPALQITFLEGGLVDIDLDLSNPRGGDLRCAVIHAAEFVWHKVTGRKSDQQRIADWLDRRFGKEVAA